MHSFVLFILSYKKVKTSNENECRYLKMQTVKSQMNRFLINFDDSYINCSANHPHPYREKLCTSPCRSFPLLLCDRVSKTSIKDKQI